MSTPMRNLTNTTTCEAGMLSCIQDQVLYSILVATCIVGLYLLASTALYVVLNGNQIRSLSAGPSSHQPSISAQINKIVMLGLCLSTAILFVVQLCLQQVQCFVSMDEASWPHLNLAFKYIYALQIVFGYAFMWTRQRLLYYGSSPLRNLHSQKTPLIALSTFSLFFVIANVIIQLSLAWYWTEDMQVLEGVTWLVLCLFVQGTLIGLFLYPLWKLNKERKRTFKPFKGDSRISKSYSISRLIRRCTILAGIFFFTDLASTFAFVLHRLLEPEAAIPVLIQMLLVDVNSITNLFCMTGSFSNWSIIFFPRKAFKRMRQKSNHIKRGIYGRVQHFNRTVSVEVTRYNSASITTRL